MLSIKRFAPQYVTLDGDVVYLEVSPERIIREIRGHVQKLPVEYQPQSVIKELNEASEMDGKETGDSFVAPKPGTLDNKKKTKNL